MNYSQYFNFLPFPKILFFFKKKQNSKLFSSCMKTTIPQVFDKKTPITRLSKFLNPGSLQIVNG
jgi:hypothetical protein